MRSLLVCLSILVCSALPAFAACTFDLQPKVDYFTFADTRNFVVARLNGDAYPDVALRVEASDRIRVLLGTANGGFGFPSEVQAGLKLIFDLESGDFNGDGFTDLVTSTGWPATGTATPAVLVLLGNGDGTFDAPLVHSMRQVPLHFSIADFNHDGKLDVATAKSSSFGLLLGKGDGTFELKTSVTLLAESNITHSPHGITHGDFDADGHLDVAVSEIYSDNIHLFFGVGDGTFTRGPLLPHAGGFWPQRIRAGDLDADGDADLVYGQDHGHAAGDRQLIVYPSNGSERTFAEAVPYGALPGGGFDTELADLDGDGDLDVLLACIDHTTVLFNDGNGAFPEQESYGDDGYEAKAADMNGDGSLELLVAGFHQDEVSVFENVCAGVTLNLTSSPSPSVIDNPVTFTASIVAPSSPSPTGTLTLKHGDVTLGTRNLSASLTLSHALSSLPEGTHTLTATYSGDANFPAMTRHLQHVVELPPYGAPSNLSATSVGGLVTVTWVGTKDVFHYEVWRRGGGGPWTFIGASEEQSFLDATASPSAAWLYKVRGVPEGPGAETPFSNADLVSTFTFTDETLTAGASKIRRAHVTELRDAVNAARAAAGLAAAPWTDATPTIVKAIHFNELRTALEQARVAAGMSAGTYAVPAVGSLVKALHVTQLRTALR
ncbi:MAG TPA: FG-GAP-like repeat-containing protein [Thermoanaerobaculia bacterium]|jgi:hypothetical protein